MANHLFIGLGGTGGKILRAMRRRVFEEFGTNSPDTPTHIDYIYVDSDENDLNDNRSWNYMGNPVHLAPNQKVNIHGIGGGVLNNLDSYPGIRSFITHEDREQLRSDAVTGIIDTGIGGQRRRFGRILMANNVVNNPHDSYSAALQNHIHSITNRGNGDGKISFHIVAGLAGGTGSGSIVDAIAQLHKIIEPMGREFEIFLYLYVPEILVEAKYNAGFYHANGYAALQELNAISLGNAYHPTDIAGSLDLATGKVKRLISGTNSRPFKMAYLFSDRNENSRVLRKDTKLPSAIADFMFQKTFGQENGSDCQMQKLINLENNAGAPEKDENGKNIHDRHFMTFGIVRITYPESEIKEYAIEECESSVCCGLNYNLWVDQGGFKVETEEAAGIGINIEVKSPTFLENMHLSHEYLTLQRPLADYPGSEQYCTFEEYWTNITTFFADDIINGKLPRQSWVAEFDDLCANEYEANFRNLGVNRYFANLRQQSEVRRLAAVICNHIEKTIFKEWINGQHSENQRMSLQKAEIYIKELESATRDRIPMIDNMKAVLVQDRDEALRVAEGDRNLLTNTGFLSNLLFAAAKKHFLNYVAQKKRTLVCNTTIEACDFARLVLEEVLSRLNEMGRSISLLRNMFRTCMEDTAARAANSCQPAEQNFSGDGEVQVVIKRFDPEVVRTTVQNDLLVDENFQQQMTRDTLQKFRNVAENAGNPKLFASLYDALGGKFAAAQRQEEDEENVEVLLNILSEVNQHTVETKLNQLAEENNEHRILGVNILDKIRNACATDVQIEQFIRDNLASRAKCFLQFAEAEIGMNNGQGTPVAGIQVVLPAGGGEFRNRFITKLLEIPGVDTTSISSSENNKQNEIVMITVKSGFPLRVIQNLNYLKQQYDNLVSPHNPQSALNKVLLHTETLPSKDLPSLFEADPAERQRAMILLAIKLHSIPGLIHKGVHPETGDEVNVVTIGSGFNASDMIVGKDAVDTARKLSCDAELRRMLPDYLDNQIAERYPTSRAKQELMKQIEDMVCTDVLKTFGNNRLSPDFREYVTVAQEYFKTIS